jgi:hypothetical protein
MILTIGGLSILRGMQIESNRKSRLARLEGPAIRLCSAIGMLLIIASLLQGCALYVLKAVEDGIRAERTRTKIKEEIRARPVDDPGPTATVAMIPLGGSTAESVEQSQANRESCEVAARMDRTSAWSAATKFPRRGRHTDLYVVCMVGNGYRCADHSEHPLCAAAWIHPTATRTQWIQDSGECRLVILRKSYLDCMAAKGYRPDVGEMGEPRRRPE